MHNEQILTEKSAMPSAFKQAEGGKELVSYLHKKLKLSHDLEFDEIKKISWTQLSESVVIFIGSSGIAALYKQYYDYVVYYPEQGEIKEKVFTRGSTPSANGGTDYAMHLVKERVGRITSMFAAGIVGSRSKVILKKLDREKNKDYSDEPNAASNTISLLRRKFTKQVIPVVAKIAEKQIASYIGLASSRAKAGAFELARKALVTAEQLSKITNDEDYTRVETAIDNAVILTFASTHPEISEYTRKQGSVYVVAWHQLPGETYFEYGKMLQSLLKRDNMDLFSTFFQYFKRSI